MRSHKYGIGVRGGWGGPKHSYWLVIAIKTYTCLSVFVFVVKVFSETVFIHASK